MEIRQSSSFQQNIPLMVFRGRLEVGVLQGWGLGGLATIGRTGLWVRELLSSLRSACPRRDSYALLKLLPTGERLNEWRF
jgi:hypothetical protein